MGTSGSTFSFTCDGAHAEYAVVPAAGVVPIPKGLSFAQAANLGTTWTTAQLALKRARTKKGETVMVLGASGAVGNTVVQLAMRMGCSVLKVSRGEEAEINSVADPALEGARTLTEGRGPDVIVDTIGDANLVKASLGVFGSWWEIQFHYCAEGHGGEWSACGFLDGL